MKKELNKAEGLILQAVVWLEVQAADNRLNCYDGITFEGGRLPDDRIQSREAQVLHGCRYPLSGDSGDGIGSLEEG